jgi:hypothetical protein
MFATLKKHSLEVLLVFVLVVLSGYLRFKDLGYSEYIPDEVAVLMELKEQGSYSMDFFLTQRKGPLQYILAYIPFLLTGDIFNELAIRIPFACVSVLAVFFFYKFVREVTKSKWIAFFSTFLLMVNGFVVAFGRIVQYQSLNLLFSSISLYLFAKHRSVWGTAFLCLSFISHWDAIYVFPIAAFLFLGQVFGMSDIRARGILIGKCLGVGLLVLMPFMLPYGVRHLRNTDNQEYFASRAGVDSVQQLNFGDKISNYAFRAELYNPFFFLSFILAAAALAVFAPSKSWIFYVWLVFVFGFFLFFIRKPGTHVYNMFLPLSVLAGIGIFNVFEFIRRVVDSIGNFLDRFRMFGAAKFLVTGVVLIPLVCVFGFFYYQTHEIFVDHSVEYPWQQEHLSFGRLEHLEKFPWLIKLYPDYGQILETKSYDHTNLTNNIIGFPLYRNWEDANAFLVARNSETGQNLGYITNETRSIAAFYIDLDYAYDLEDSYYAVGVKRPLSFVKDYKFSQIRGKNTIHKVSDELNGTFIQIYLVNGQ